MHNRKTISRYRSGGIALIVKNCLVPHINVLKSNSPLIFWFSINHTITINNETVYCGIVYIPPYRSKYSNDDPYLEIQRELDRICINSKNILLMGDFNSRTGTLNDFVIPDKFICESQGNVSLLNENLSIIQCLERNNIPIKRSSADQVRNVYGNQLIEFCKNNDLFIVNGRLNKSNSPPKTTCKDKSTIDYFISTAYNFDFLHSFEVQDFNSLFSDSYCPLSLEIDVCLSENKRVRTNRKDSNTHEARLWIDGKKDEYLQNFDSKRVDEILDKLTGLNSSDKLSQLDIDNIVRDIEWLLTENAKTTFGYKKNKTS